MSVQPLSTRYFESADLPMKHAGVNFRVVDEKGREVAMAGPPALRTPTGDCARRASRVCRNGVHRDGLTSLDSAISRTHRGASGGDDAARLFRHCRSGEPAFSLRLLDSPRSTTLHKSARGAAAFHVGSLGSESSTLTIAARSSNELELFNDRPRPIMKDDLVMAIADLRVVRCQGEGVERRRLDVRTRHFGRRPATAGGDCRRQHARLASDRTALSDLCAM